MKNFYDVQQFLKGYGLIIYMGKRLYDIELAQIVLERLYDAGIMDRLDYIQVQLILKKEQQEEWAYLEQKEKKEKCLVS